MKKILFIALALIAFFPTPVRASCHARFTFDVVGPNPDDPKRVGIGENITFKTKFQIDAGAAEPCNRERFEITWNELRGRGLRPYEIRTRPYVRDRDIFPGRELNADFSIAAEGESGRRAFTASVSALPEGGLEVPEVIVGATVNDLFVIEGITARELTESEKQGVGAPQGGPVRLGVRIGDFVEAANLAQYVGTVINYLTRLLILIATVMVIAAGFMWLIAGGAPDKITAAKKRITNAVIGLALGLSTLLLLNLINPALVELKELKIPSVVRQSLNCLSGSIGCVCRETIGDAPRCSAGLNCVTGRYILATDENEVLRASLNAGLAGAGLGFLGGNVGRGAVAGAVGAAGKIVQVPGEGAVLEQATIRGRALAAVRGGVGGAKSVALSASGFWITAAVGGASAGVAAVINMGSSQELCSDGKLGSPCGDNDDCQGGLKCNDYAKICFQPPSPPGGICNEDEDCASGSCQEYEGTGENPKYCRGNKSFRGTCSVDTECQTGLVCIVPLSKSEGRCGYLKTSQEPDDDDFNGNPCAVGVQASGCRKRSDYKSCMYCPATGNRVWQRLEASTPAYDRILGSCKSEESYHQGCVAD